MKVCILGVGKMGSALAMGIARGPSGATARGKGASLMLCDHSHAKAAALARKTGAGVAKTAKEAVEGADAIIIAVKPDATAALLEEIRKELGETLIISVVAGLPLSYFKKRVPRSCRVALIMPNLAVQIGKGATMYFAESHMDANEIEALLAPTGLLMRAKKESDMDTAFLHSSGVAFFLAAIEGMAKAGERHGLAYSQALALSAKAAEGAGALVLEKGIRPLEIEGMVSTQKGITMHGLRILREAKVRENFHRAAHAVIREAKRRRRKNR
ncbi:MAG: NAD(P)-binding domain-containing protein [Candidatus Micrarchaeota archaeon]|nr:NAD(P)-binding domain-containing protein [Candidatus Micrarchaeota archaeon]